MGKTQITPNLALISNETKTIVNNSLELSPAINKPLLIMPTWLMATEKPILKYANFYLRNGFDILNVQMDLWQLLWPVKGAQVLAGEILEFLESNKNYTKMVIHGFSIGCYLWGEVLVLIEANRSRYQFIIDNTIGQIWDSPADITRIPTGVSYATFPNNKFLQNALKSYAIYHLNTFDEEATTHYLKSRSAMYNNPMRTPILMFGSKKDPISTEESIRKICDHWKENGIKVDVIIWDDTEHVSHMAKYPDDYLEQVSRYLEDIGVGIRYNAPKANL